MKIVIIKSNLRDGLSFVGRSTGENQNLPILKNILFEAMDGQVHLTATNLELAAHARLSGKVLEPGKVSVPAGVLGEIINNLKNERLNLESVGANLCIKTDNYEATVQGLPSEDFPIIPKAKNQEKSVELGGDILKEALAQVSISAQTNELRPELGGVLALFSLDNLRFVATDSFRLSEKTLSGSRVRATSEPFSALIPLKTCHELLRTTKDTDTVRLFYDGNQMLFKTEQNELISRLIDGTFPDYAAIIPKEFENKITLSRNDFIDAVRLAGVLSSRSGEVRLVVGDNKKTLSVSSAEQGVGENTQHIAIHATGGPQEICFNWHYLLDGLKCVPGEEVVFGLNHDNKPALLRSAADTSFFYVVMPILKT